MHLRSTHNGGVVTVDSAFGQRLIDGGGWEDAEAPKPARRRARARQEPAPAEEQKTEE